MFIRSIIENIKKKERPKKTSIFRKVENCVPLQRKKWPLRLRAHKASNDKPETVIYQKFDLNCKIIFCNSMNNNATLNPLILVKPEI